jgi:hypothetical protein
MPKWQYGKLSAPRIRLPQSLFIPSQLGQQSKIDI